MRRPLLLVLAVLADASWLAPAAAQALRDPTQPPAVVAPGAAGVTAQIVSNEPRLQSVLISHRANGRRVAVIDGETLRVGDTFREAKVVKISPTLVVLRHGAQEQILVMAEPSTAREQAPLVARTTSAAKADDAGSKASGMNKAEEALMKALGVAKDSGLPGTKDK